MRTEQRENSVKLVRPRHRQPKLLKQRLEELFGGLLTVEANGIMNRRQEATDPCRDDVVGFGLRDPLPGQPFHRVPCPWPRPHARTSPRPSGASACCGGC